MGDVRTAIIWIAPDKAHQLFGSIFNNTITFESGASIWLPAQPDHHMLRGYKLTASGNQQQLQQLASKLLAQASRQAQFVYESESAQWYYLNDQDVQFGPFSGKQLHKYNNSGAWSKDFPICYGPASIWLPIWLVLQLLGLQSQQMLAGNATTNITAGVTTADQDDEDYGATLAHRTHRKYHAARQYTQPQSSELQGTSSAWHAASSSHAHVLPAFDPAPPAVGSADMSGLQHLHSTSYGWPAAAAAYPNGSHSFTQRENAHGANGIDDAGSAALLAEVARLRQDAAYLDELSRAVDMDWEPVLLHHATAVEQQSHAGHDQQASSLGEHISDLTAVQQGTASTCAVSEQTGEQGAVMQAELKLIVDTNVLLDSRGLQMLQLLLDMQQRGCGNHTRVVVVLPWTVLVELDKLKARPGTLPGDVSVSSQARIALRFLESVIAPSSTSRHMFKPQSIQEFRCAAREFSFGVADKGLVADDRILQCAMHYHHQQQQQQQQKAGVVLLTNDRVLLLKAQANAVPSASLKELPLHSISNEQQQLQEQQLLGRLKELAGLALLLDSSHAQHIHNHSSSKPAAAAATATAQQHQPQQDTQDVYTHTANQQQQQQQAQPVLSNAEVAAAAFHHITQLRLGLTDRVIAVLKAEFEELWLDVLSSKPPWSDLDFLYVLHKHWRSALQDHLLPAARHASKQLEAAVQYLLDTFKQLRHNSYNQLPMAQLQQNVAVRVVQLLEAFGAAAAAADVAAAAGLGSGNDSSTTAGTVGSPSVVGSFPKAICPGNRQRFSSVSRSGSVDRTGSGSGAVAQAGIPPAAGTAGLNLTQGSAATVVGEGRQETVAAAAGGGGRGIVAGASQLTPSTPKVAANSVAVDSVGSPGRRKIKHALRHPQQQQQQHMYTTTPQYAAQPPLGAACTQQQQQQQQDKGNNKRQCVTVGVAAAGGQCCSPTQQQQQGSSATENNAQQQQQDSNVTPDYGQQQQGGSIMPYHGQQQQGHEQLSAAAAVSIDAAASAAAATVPVPSLEGPCLRLQQLLQYATQLLAAVMLPLQQAVQQQQRQQQQGSGTMRPAADAAVQRYILALLQHLQQVVQMFEWLVLQVQQQQQGCLQPAAAVAGAFQEPVVQLGLGLVRMCAFLIAAAAAAEAVVSAQIATNAVEFAQDAVMYIMQPGSNSCTPAIAIGFVAPDTHQISNVEPWLLQLKCAQQQLQLLLSQTQAICSFQPS